MDEYDVYQQIINKVILVNVLVILNKSVLTLVIKCVLLQGSCTNSSQWL